jgi:hypothetical protein
MPPTGTPPGPAPERASVVRRAARRLVPAVVLAVLPVALALAQSPAPRPGEADRREGGTTDADPVASDTTTAANLVRNPYGTGMGFEVLITNSGFGLGGYFRQAIGTQTSFLGEISIGTEKNEREVKFVGLRRNYVPDKANYFLRMPIKFGLQRRLFEDDIEDNFRPYLQLSTGPTLGWIYPYFDDENGNNAFDDGERQYDGFGSLFKGSFRFGFGGTFGLGAYFGESKRLAQGVRIAYSFNYFFDDIQLLEPDDQVRPERFFDTPTISITFGRLN